MHRPEAEMRTRAAILLALCMLSGVPHKIAAQTPADVRAVVNRAIRASGGENRLSHFKAATWTVTGKFYETKPPTEFTSEWAHEVPDRVRAVLHARINGERFDVVTVFNRDAGWIRINGKTHAMTSEETTETKQELHLAELSRLIDLKRRDLTLSSLGAATSDGRPVVVIKVVAAGFPDVKLSFDKETGLPAKAETTVHDNRTGKNVTQETLFSDYHDVDGIKIPLSQVIRRDGQPYKETVAADFKIADRLDESLFEKP
jgi:outer membrane lipoprotein-sorting protein